MVRRKRPLQIFHIFRGHHQRAVVDDLRAVWHRKAFVNLVRFCLVVHLTDFGERITDLYRNRFFGSHAPFPPSTVFSVVYLC